MTREEIRQELIAYLRQALTDRKKAGAIQLVELCQHLQRKVGYPAVRSAHQIARELLQEFVNNNVLFIGHGDSEGFPWFTVTEYGSKVESRMGAGADAKAPSRFPSPLIKPDMRISSHPAFRLVSP